MKTNQFKILNPINSEELIEFIRDLIRAPNNNGEYYKKRYIDSHAFTDVVLTLTDYRLSRLARNWLSSPPLQMGSSR